MIPMRKNLILSAAALLIAGTLIAVALNTARTGTPPQPRPRLVFAVASLIDSAPVIIARQQDFFAREGLDVELRFYGSGREALGAMLRGEAHLATVADLPVALAALDGSDFRLLSTICKSGRANSIVARKDRGISSANHIRGKVVGVIPGTTSEFMLDEFLMLHDIPRTAITTIPMKPEETVAALVSGRVDAVSTWSQHTASIMKGLGSSGVRFFSEETYQMYWNVVARGELVVGHKDQLRRLVKALNDATGYMATHDAAARKDVMATFRLDKGQLDAVWAECEFEQTLDQPLLLTLENQARWALHRKSSAIRELPDFRRLIYLDALSDIAPAAVTVIR